MGVAWRALLQLLGILHCGTSAVAGINLHGGSGTSAGVSSALQAGGLRAHDLDVQPTALASTLSDSSAKFESSPFNVDEALSGRTLLHGCHGKKKGMNKRCVPAD